MSGDMDGISAEYDPILKITRVMVTDSHLAIHGFKRVTSIHNFAPVLPQVAAAHIRDLLQKTEDEKHPSFKWAAEQKLKRLYAKFPFLRGAKV